MLLKGLPVSDFQDASGAAIGQPVHGALPHVRLQSLERMGGRARGLAKAGHVRRAARLRLGRRRAFQSQNERESARHLMLMGACEDGRKRLVGMGEGYAERSYCWRELLAKLRRQGMDAPKLVVEDGDWAEVLAREGPSPCGERAGLVSWQRTSFPSLGSRVRIP